MSIKYLGNLDGSSIVTSGPKAEFDDALDGLAEAPVSFGSSQGGSKPYILKRFRLHVTAVGLVRFKCQLRVWG